MAPQLYDADEFVLVAVVSCELRELWHSLTLKSSEVRRAVAAALLSAVGRKQETGPNLGDRKSENWKWHPFGALPKSRKKCQIM